MWSREGDVISTSESVAALGMPLDWRYFILKLCRDVAVIPHTCQESVFVGWECKHFLEMFSNLFL